MITCHECVNALSTTRLSEIRAGSPVAVHYSRCDACSRVVQDLYDAERELAGALDQFRPTSTFEQIADHAVDAGFRRRRRIARAVRGILALAATGVVFIAFEVLRDPPSTIEERFFLSCITPTQASAIAEEHMETGGTIQVSSDERTIFLKGRYEEVQAAQAEIRIADNSSVCDRGQPAPDVTVPAAPAPEVIVTPPAVVPPALPAPDKSGTG